MHIADQVDAWRAVGRDLGVEVVSPFRAVLGNGDTLSATALVKVGPLGGMVVDPDYEIIRPYADVLLSEGFGYSAVSLDTPYDASRDRESLIEVLEDWGWMSPVDL